jgi:hypothetical protein
MKDTYIDTYNLIFETLYKLHTRERHALPSLSQKVEATTQNIHNLYTRTAQLYIQPNRKLYLDKPPQHT